MNAEIIYDENELDALSNNLDYMQISDMDVIKSSIESGVPSEKIVFHLILQGNERLLNTNISFSVENLKNINEICHTLSKDIWNQSYDGNDCIANKMYDNNCISWTIKYDCSRSIANKIRQAMKLNLAGVMISYLSTDDFLGKCNIEADTFADFHPHAGVMLNIPTRNVTTFFALRTVYEAIELTLDEMDQRNEIL